MTRPETFWLAIVISVLLPLLVGRLIDPTRCITDITKLLGYGAATTIVAFGAELEFQAIARSASLDPETTAFVAAFIIAGFLEELIRFFILDHIIRKLDKTPIIVMLAASMWVSLGFAVVENALYVIGSSPKMAVTLAIVRFVWPTTMHLFAGVLQCAGIVRLLGMSPKFTFPAAVLFHGVFDWVQMNHATHFYSTITLISFCGFIATSIIVRQARVVDAKACS